MNFNRSHIWHCTGAIATATVVTGTFVMMSAPSTQAQDNLTTQPRIQISPQALSEIREAPFSELFDIGDSEAFAVKDQDYNAAQPAIGFFSLWGDVPSREALGVAVKYCFEDTSLARANAELVEMKLMDGETELVTIDQVTVSRAAYLNEVQPPRQSNVHTSFYYDPWYDPFYYSPFRLGVTVAPPVYTPGVNCSAGAALFDLTPVQDEIAALPEQTLNVRLLFSNGATEYWRLGGGTVSELKQLPTIAAMQ
ncbi:MAG: hypothetical protein F6K00_32790 [Leptolyngbya sp. SIOISBB]|nr:hypothetical protein [Leptolyngbya sp. SIOISBB]